jgi:hypothetical protein
MIKVAPADLSQLDDLMDVATYEKFVEEEETKGGH